MIANTVPSKSKKVWKADDFMPKRKKPKQKAMTVQQSVDYAATLNRLLGGVDLRELNG